MLQDPNIDSNTVEGAEINDVIKKYTSKWKWFILFALLGLLGAQIYLRYATPKYLSTATILLKNESAGANFSELSALEDMGFFSGKSSKKLLDELEVIRSRRLMTKVVVDLGLYARYYSIGNVKSTELYKDGIVLRFLEERSIYNLNSKYQFEIIPVDDSSFRIFQNNSTQDKVYKLGEAIDLGFGRFTLLPYYDVIDEQSQNVIFNLKNTLIKITPIDQVAQGLTAILQASPKAKSSNVLSISIEDALKERSRDILNNLIKQYNDDHAKDRNQISQSTSEFIAKRLSIIAVELDSVETGKASFKRDNKITNIESDTQIFLENANEYDKQLVLSQTNIELAENVLNELENDVDLDTYIPVSVLSLESQLASQVDQYNSLVAQRQRLLSNSTEENPVVKQVSNVLKSLKTTISAGLDNEIESLKLRSRRIRAENSSFKSKISSMPTLEKKARDIVRQQEIKEQLYLYLLQKREETAIAMSVNSDNAKVIDAASTNNVPVSPKRLIIMSGAAILGLILVFVSIYLRTLLDTKVHSRSELEHLTSSPILGELPLIAKEEEERIQENDRSILAESFRILRTNLGYLSRSNSNDNKKNVIYVTSTVKGEGKTFVAFNLLLTLASTGKRVVILGADIRNPQVHRYLDLKSSSIGLSEYLYDDSVKLENIITTEKINNKEIDVVLSGRIPPNPAELLLSNRFSEVIESLSKSYDYVIVDTAPTMQVTDTLLISKYADITLFVTRAEYTNKRLLQYSQDLKKEGKLNNLAYVVNGVKSTNFGYGAKYGYGYGNEDEGWLQRLKRVLFS